MSAGYEQSFLRARAAAEEMAVPPPPPPLLTHRVHSRRFEQQQYQQQQQQPPSAPSSSSRHLPQRLLEASEWAKLARFHVSTHQQAQASRRHAEVLLSSALRCHPTALEGSKLSLASSSVTHIDRLPPAVTDRVKTLYLSSNSVASIENLGQFAHLTTLSAASNCLRYLQELRPLGSLAQLEKLSLEGNIVASMPYYREHVLGLCPRLTSLDNKAVSGAERSQARAEFKRVGALLEELRCNELRHAALAHLLSVLRCRAELGRGRVVGNPLPDLAALLRVLCAGGVFRWAQIGCADQYDRTVQDLALRAHLQAQRRASQSQRMQLSRRADALSEHWRALCAECAAFQRQQLMRLLQAYEGQREQGQARGPVRSPRRELDADGDGDGDGGEAAMLSQLSVLVFDSGASASELSRVFGGEHVSSSASHPATAAAAANHMPFRSAAATGAGAGLGSAAWSLPLAPMSTQATVLRRSLDSDKRAAPAAAADLDLREIRGSRDAGGMGDLRGSRDAGGMGDLRGSRDKGGVGEMRGSRDTDSRGRKSDAPSKAAHPEPAPKTSTELLGEQRAAAQTQYQSLLRAMSAGAAVGAGESAGAGLGPVAGPAFGAGMGVGTGPAKGAGAGAGAGVGAFVRGPQQLGSLSSLLPPQQEEPEAAAPMPMPIPRRAGAAPVAPVAASVSKAKTAGPGGRRASPTRTASSAPSSSSSSSASSSNPSGAAAGKVRAERGAKSSAVAGPKPEALSAGLGGFDFGSERFRALMARAREPQSDEAAALLSALEALWRRPLPELEVRPASEAASVVEAVLGPEPRAPYQRPEAAGSINELKLQIQATLNDLSQYQREEYLTWAASEYLKKHAAATHRAVVDVADAALGKLAALGRVTTTCHADVAVAADWAQQLAPTLARVEDEAKKISALRESIAAARRRQEAAETARRDEDAKRADLLRSAREVDEATAVMVAEIEANPQVARLVRSELAVTSALDLSERADSLLRKILRLWRVRVRRQRRIRKFAVAQARRVKGRVSLSVFAHWARVARVARVSARIQRSLLRRAAKTCLSQWRRAGVQGKRLLRLSHRRPKAPCRAALRRWALASVEGRAERHRRRELEAVAACFIKIRVFRGWQRHTAACRLDPATERLHTATALRFALHTRFSAWAALAGAQARRAREGAGVAAAFSARAVLTRTWRQWRLHLRCGRFARLCGGRRGLLGLARRRAVRREGRRRTASVLRHRLFLHAASCLRFWLDLCARRRHAAGAGRLVAARWMRCLVKSNWRRWGRLCREAQLLRMRDRAAMHFYLSLLLRRHFFAWRALFPAGQRAALEEAAEEARARARAVEMDDEESVAASSVLIQTLHAHITLVEAALAAAVRFFRSRTARRALGRMRSRAWRRRRLRRQSALLRTRCDLQVRRAVFSAWQGLWLRSLQAGLQRAIEPGEVASTEAEVAALRAAVGRLREDHDRARGRAEHLSVGCEEHDARLADTDLALREVQLVLDARTREAEELRASIRKLEGECRLIVAAKQARDDLHSGRGPSAGGLFSRESDADSEALVAERESALRDQQSQLACQEEAYTRAVLLQSQAQLKQDKLAAEAKAAAAMLRHHKKEVESHDAALRDLADKRAHAERALAFCANSLQECVDRAAGLEQSQEGSEQQLAAEQADLETRLAMAEAEEAALSRELEELRRASAGRGRLAAVRRECVAQLDSIDLLGVSQATLLFAEEDVKASSAAALLGLGLDFEGRRDEKENRQVNSRLKPLRRGGGGSGKAVAPKPVAARAALTNEAVLAKRIRSRAAGHM